MELNTKRGEDGLQSIFLCFSDCGSGEGASQPVWQVSSREPGPPGSKVRAAECSSQALAAQIHCIAAISAASLEKVREHRSSQQHEMKQS